MTAATTERMVSIILSAISAVTLFLLDLPWVAWPILFCLCWDVVWGIFDYRRYR